MQADSGQIVKNETGIDLSIVIITWRMKEYLFKLLESIRIHTTKIKFEVIIVDNFSGDGTVEMIEERYPQCVLIKNKENRGVAPARNQAFRVARGRYIVTLDADMALVENSLERLIFFMDSMPKVGLCGCKLIFPDGVVQPSGRRYPTLFAFILRRLEFLSVAKKSKTLRYHEMTDWDRSDSRQVDYVIGACQFIRREAITSVGFLDDNIFYGPEDIDYCLRMYHNGWKVYYYADTKIIHYEQRITKKRLFTKLSWFHFKGIMYLYIKHRGRLSKE